MSYTTEAIDELTKEVVGYEPSPARMPLDRYLPRKIKQIILSLIGSDEEQFMHGMSDVPVDWDINKEMAIRNELRHRLKAELEEV